MQEASQLHQSSFLYSPKYRKQFFRSNVLSHIFLFIAISTYLLVTTFKYNEYFTSEHLMFSVVYGIMFLLSFVMIQILYLPFFAEKVKQDRERKVQEWKRKLRNPRRDSHGEIIHG